MIVLHFPNDWNLEQMETWTLKHWAFLWPNEMCKLSLVQRDQWQPENLAIIVFPKPMVAAIKARGRDIIRKDVNVTGKGPDKHQALRIYKEVPTMQVLGSTMRKEYAELQNGSRQSC